MKFSVKLLESNKDIETKILKAMIKDCRNTMQQAMNKVKNNLSRVIEDSILNSPEYNSLVSGILRLELGIPDANTKIAGLISTWISNIRYEYKAPTIQGSQIKSNFSVYAIQSDFSDVLGTDYAIVVDSVRGYSLPWLEWLLLDGSGILVANHEVVFGSNARSRTGMAIMKTSPKGWKISEFSGTASNNWITRAISSSEAEIKTILERAFA